MPDATKPEPAAPTSTLETPVKRSLKDILLSNGPWPLVAILAVGGGTFASIAIFAPEDTRMALFGAHGIFFTLLAWLARSPLSPPSGS